VKNLKYGVLGFGVLGLVGLLVMGGLMNSLKHDAANTIMVLVGFIAPIAMGAMGLKAPFKRWQGIVALLGFVLVAVKFRAWEMIKFIGLMPMGMKLAIISCLVGAVVAAITVAVPEES
jgi:hypothetical protein